MAQSFRQQFNQASQPQDKDVSSYIAPFYEAIQNGDQQAFLDILTQAPEVIRQPAWQDVSWLITVARKATGGTAQFFTETLLAAGMDPNTQDLDKGYTALMHAVHHRNTEVIQTLLHHPKTDMSVKNHEGETAAKLAQRRGSSTVLTLFANRKVPNASQTAQEKAEKADTQPENKQKNLRLYLRNRAKTGRKA